MVNIKNSKDLITTPCERSQYGVDNFCFYLLEHDSPITFDDAVDAYNIVNLYRRAEEETTVLKKEYEEGLSFFKQLSETAPQIQGIQLIYLLFLIMFIKRLSHTSIFITEDVSDAIRAIIEQRRKSYCSHMIQKFQMYNFLND